MDFIRVMGFFSIVPATLLITVSFFVLFLLFKVEKSGLRIFGLVVVALLWIAAVIVYSTGIFMIAEGTDYDGAQGVYSPCKCQCANQCSNQCSKMRGYGCEMMNGPYHKNMINPHAGLMYPHEGMMMDPHHGMMDAQSSPDIKK